MVSIIIVNYNVYADVMNCIESIKEFEKDISYEIIVVDNNSHDRSIEKITTQIPDVIFMPLEQNYGFGYANNRAMEIAKGEYFLLMNPDIEVSDDSILSMVEYIKANDNVAAVGPVQINPNSGIERYYSLFPSFYSRMMQEFGLYVKAPFMKQIFNQFWNDNIRKGKPFDVDWIIGSCLLLRRKIFENVGGFEEAFFLFEEEVEWEYRMHKKGWRKVILPYIKVLHNHHTSISKIGENYRRFHEFRSRIIFSKKHDKFPINYLRNILVFLGLSIRLLRGIFLKRYRIIGNKKVHYKLYLVLFKLVFSSRINVLKDRFDPNCIYEYSNLL